VFVPVIWIVFNAWSQKPSEPDDTDWISEAAVEDEVSPVAGAIEARGYKPLVYPLFSVPDAVIRLCGPEKPELIFNLAEGFQGKARLEMSVAALYELCDIPYTGNSARTLAIAQNKALSKRLFETEGIPTPSWRLYEGILPDLSGMEFPLIAKPSREDASLGIGADGVYKERAGLEAGLVRLYRKYKQPILIESYIDGREFNASILENRGKPEILPLSEITFEGVEPGKPKITSYEAKWHTDSPLYHATPAECPASAGPELRERIEDLALRTFKLLGGKDYGRVDLRVDGKGNPYVLEYNPNPDISLNGGFVRSLTASGRTYDDFIAILLENNLQHVTRSPFADAQGNQLRDSADDRAG
jgi:D-alanine-D-alanine ligase